MKRNKLSTELAVIGIALLIVVIASACHNGYQIGTAARAIEENLQYYTAVPQESTEPEEEKTEPTVEAEPEEPLGALKQPQISAEPIRRKDIPEEINALKTANNALYEVESEWRWSEADEQVLVKIAMAEAGGEGVIGKALVMRVVINRAESDRFPNTISGVVFQKLGDVYQFSPVGDGGVINCRTPDAECYEALAMVKDGWDDSNGATFFEAAPNTANTWHSRNLKYLFRYGGHSFYALPDGC